MDETKNHPGPIYGRRFMGSPPGSACQNGCHAALYGGRVPGRRIYGGARAAAVHCGGDPGYGYPVPLFYQSHEAAGVPAIVYPGISHCI